mgnify:CR=1 FL=1
MKTSELTGDDYVDALIAELATIKGQHKQDGLDAATMAQDYCRSLWGSSRGRPEWREAHNGFVAGYIAAGAQPAMIYPLPDDLYDSKDWRDGGYAERVEWLHSMYESTKATLDAYLEAEEKQQEPVAWVYPEGLEALRAGKPWTAYGTRQEPNNTAFYLSPQPDIPPYAWVTFTPYGDEDDVWYENPEGQLLEGWTYKPLYDTTPPQRKPLTGEQIEKIVDSNTTDDCGFDIYCDGRGVARAIESAHGIGEKNHFLRE